MSIIYTIGSSGKNAKSFFELLRKNNVSKLIDVRLHNTSHLAGYTKKNDLEYFLDKILSIKYIHLPILAPTDKILKDYKSGAIDWKDYETNYIDLMKSRNISSNLDNIDFNKSCLLCSEQIPDHCHRRLAAEILKDIFLFKDIIHL